MSRRFPRRLFLKGFGGAVIALPLLEFTESRAYGQTTVAPKRFVTFFEHGGTLSNCLGSTFSDGTGSSQGMNGWRPASTPGQPLELGPIHAPLAAAGLTGDVVVLRGIDNYAADAQGKYGSGHGVANKTILTACKCKAAKADDDGTAEVSSPSIDQVIASRWGAPAGGVASVNLYINAHNYGTPYFAGPMQTASRISDPRAAFTALLAGVQSSADAGVAGNPVLRAQLVRRSILDGTAKELDRYRNQLTGQDKLMIDAHLEHVRTIEARLASAAMAPPPSASCSPPTIGSYSGIPQTAPLMVDIGLAALRCGRTRVLNIEIGDFHMTWDPTPIPFTVAFNIGHSLDHMARDLGATGSLAVPNPTWTTPYQQTMIRNRQFRATMVANLLKGLKATSESGGTMLDNSLFLWTSEFSNGSVHSGKDMPFVLAGKAGGSLQTGRYLNFNTKAAADDFVMQYASQTTTNNLYISVLQKLGFTDTTFGDMTYAKVPGPIASL